MQLRNPCEEVHDYILDKVEKDNKAKISKMQEVRGGIDYYFTSQKYLLALGKHLQEKYGGELKTSRRLFSRSKQTSKDIYRVTVLLRLPGFKVGDVISVRRDTIRVTAIGKNILGVSTETGRKVTLNYKQLE